MPLLAGLIAGLFASIAEFFGKWLTKKLAFGAAAIAVFAGLTTALFGVGAGIVSGLSLVAPSVPGLQLAFHIVNAPAIIASVSAVISLDSAVALYKWNCENLKLVHYIT